MVESALVLEMKTLQSDKQWVAQNRLRHVLSDAKCRAELKTCFSQLEKFIELGYLKRQKTRYSKAFLLWQTQNYIYHLEECVKEIFNGDRLLDRNNKLMLSEYKLYCCKEFFHETLQKERQRQKFGVTVGDISKKNDGSQKLPSSHKASALRHGKPQTLVIPFPDSKISCNENKNALSKTSGDLVSRHINTPKTKKRVLTKRKLFNGNDKENHLQNSEKPYEIESLHKDFDKNQSAVQEVIEERTPRNVLSEKNNFNSSGQSLDAVSENTNVIKKRRYKLIEAEIKNKKAEVLDKNYSKENHTSARNEIKNGVSPLCRKKLGYPAKAVQFEDIPNIKYTFGAASSPYSSPCSFEDFFWGSAVSDCDSELHTAKNLDIIECEKNLFSSPTCGALPNDFILISPECLKINNKFFLRTFSLDDICILKQD